MEGLDLYLQGRGCEVINLHDYIHTAHSSGQADMYHTSQGYGQVGKRDTNEAAFNSYLGLGQP